MGGRGSHRRLRDLVLIVDDALLLRVLALTAPEDILDEARTGQIFTTGSWYYRLAKAVAQPRVAGALSSAMTALPSDAEERAAMGSGRCRRSLGCST